MSADCRKLSYMSTNRGVAPFTGGKMSKRQQPPPQIKKIEVKDRSTGKSVVRYQVTVDAGHDPESGRRRQIARRFTTEAKARAELAALQAGVAAGT